MIGVARSICYVASSSLGWRGGLAEPQRTFACTGDVGAVRLDVNIVSSVPVMLDVRSDSCSDGLVRCRRADHSVGASFVRRRDSLRQRFSVEMVARTKTSLVRSSVRRDQLLRSTFRVEMVARTKMCWQRGWFGGVDRLGNVVRRECCSDDLVRGRGCCMMLASGVFDWRTADNKNHPDRTMR